MESRDNTLYGKGSTNNRSVECPTIPMEELLTLQTKKVKWSKQSIEFIHKYKDIKPHELIPYMKKYFDMDVTASAIESKQIRTRQ